MTIKWNIERRAGIALLSERLAGYPAPEDADDLLSFQDVVTYHRADQLCGAVVVRRSPGGRIATVEFAMAATAEGYGGFFFRALLRELPARGIVRVAIDVPAGGPVSGYLQRLAPWRFVPSHRRGVDHFDFLTTKAEVMP